MERITNWITHITKLAPWVQGNLFASITIILILWVIRILVAVLLWRGTDDVRVRYRWRKRSNTVTVILGCVLVGRVWFEGIQTVATFLGLLTAGLAIALKDLVTGIAGWIFIMWRRPFSVGDRIQIGRDAGDVIDVRIFKFTLMEIGNWVNADQSTGRVLHIPNGLVLSEVISNYSKGFQYIWNEIPVLVTFESDWKKAKGLLQQIVEKHAEDLRQSAEQQIAEASRRFMISYSVLTPAVYTSVSDSGVLLTIRHLCEPRTRRGISQTIWEDILNRFATHTDINFAYPTQRFFTSQREGNVNATASADAADA